MYLELKRYVQKRWVGSAKIRGSKYCCICDRKVDGFSPYRGGWKAAPSLMVLLEVVGSDIDNFSCPACGAHDRERHLFLYLQSVGLMRQFKGADILHFAPEKRLARLIKETEPSRYVKADLFPVDPDVERIDMTDIPYGAGSFDFIFANHVLEHIPNDFKALSEIMRVLRIGGLAILQTPYSPKLHSTFEDSGVDSDILRLQLYGQEDHVRLYGLDIFDRFASVGLVADIKTHESVFDNLDADYYGVNVHEPFFLYKKQ